jgi:hypothetical protein
VNSIITGRLLRDIRPISGRDELQAALHQRAEQLDVSRETLDGISGLQNGYAAKLLADPPIRGLGRISFAALTGALAVRIAVIEDTEALERLRPRLDRRETGQVRNGNRARARAAVA